MMSQTDEKTLSRIKHATLLKILFADEAGPSTIPSAPVIPALPGTDTANVATPSSDDLYTDKFDFALSKKISSTLMASLKLEDAILKEVLDCVNTGNEDRCRQIRPCIHNYWKDLHVKKCSFCVDDRINNLHSIKDAYVEAIQATHRGSWVMTSMTVHAWWPFMHRDLLSETAKCNPCVKIDKNLKSIVTYS